MLDEVRKEVKSTNPKWESMSLLVDFSKIVTLQEYRTLISDKVKHLDVALLVICAGSTSVGKFSSLDYSEVESTLRCIGLQTMYLSKCFAEMFCQRFMKK